MFFGVLPGYAFADDYTASSSVTAKVSGLNEDGSAVSYSFDNLPLSFSSGFAHVGSGFGFLNWTWINSAPFTILTLDSGSISVNISHSGLELPDLSFSYPLRVIFGYYNSTQLFDANFIFTGTATVNFSDGTSQSIPLSARSGFSPTISFSAKKVNSSNQFLISSEDFNLSANPDDKESGLTFKSRSDDNSSNLPHDEIYLGQLDIRSPRFLDMRSEATILGGGSSDRISLPTGVINATANLTTGVVSGSVSGRVNGLSLYGASFSSGSGSWSHIYIDEMDSTLAGVSVKNAEFDIAGKAVIDNAPVTIIPASDDVYITGFSVTGTISLPAQNVVFPDIGSASDSDFGTLFFASNCSYTFGASENIVAHIAGTVDNIYYTLRYTLPLQLRHLIIPTQEEVEDVISDAVKNVEDNAGGLGEAVKISNNSFNTVTNAFKNSTASGIYIPSLSIPVSGKIVTLWENFDVGPYLRSDLVQTILGPAVLILKFAITLFMVRQLMNMWESLMSGCSYLGFLRYQEMDSRDAWLDSTDELSAYLGREDWRE